MTEPGWFYIPLRVHVQARILGGMDGIRGRYRETWTLAAIWQKPASFMVALVPIILGDFDGLLCGCFFASEGARMGEWLLLLYIPLLLYDRALVYKYFTGSLNGFSGSPCCAILPPRPDTLLTIM
jgi:hypothetical protein